MAKNWTFPVCTKFSKMTRLGESTFNCRKGASASIWVQLFSVWL